MKSQSRLFVRPRCWGYAVAVAAVVPLALSRSAQAQTPTSLFPFVIPWDDAASGTATDVSWLNAGPAGSGGAIVVRDGHFVESKTGKRVRFLGTNFTFAADFPTHEDAEKVAAHLAKMGINIVRIHHHDVDYGQLWDKKKGDHRHFDADALDRLDYLIYQLKQHGVYVDLNLHVSRKLTAVDGLPASADKIATEYDKRVDRFDRTMIERQKEFAHDYLAHVNPYAHQAYVSDPCVAIVEINNENSLVGDAPTSMAGQLADLPEPFRGELVGLWNGWLQKKYGTDAGLQTAWAGKATPKGPSLITQSSVWTLEAHSPTIATKAAATEGGTDANTAPPIQLKVDKVDGTDWHIQTHVTGLNVKEGDSYTVRFQARADAPRSMGVGVRLDQADWHNLGLDTTANLTTEWQDFAYSFTASGTVPDHARLSFVLGGKTGTVDLRNVSLSPGVPADLATGGGTLAAHSIDLPKGGTLAKRNDWVRFLVDTERAYSTEMRGYLKKDLGVRANLIDTQISWSKSAGAYREAEMEFADNHSYWQHPRFPGKSWDPVDWVIENTPQIASLVKGTGALMDLGTYRIAGKPYTISEYNEPAPSDFQCETVPEAALIAATQDWDGVFLFDWGSYGATAANDKIQSFFGIGSNPAKTAFLPAAAVLFRSGAGLSPLTGSARLDLPEGKAVAAVSMSTYWGKARSKSGAMTPGQMLQTKTSVRLVPGDGDPTLTTAAGGSGGLTVSSAEGSEYLKTANGRSAIAVGYLGGQTVTMGDAQIAFGKFGNGFCAATLTPSGKSVGNLLLTIVGKVENSNMGWNDNRTSVGNKWGTGPVQAEFVPATVTVPASTGSKVWALDGSGKRVHEITSSVSNGKLTFSVDAATASLWYEIGK